MTDDARARARNAKSAALGRLHDLAERLEREYSLDLAAVGAPSCTHTRMELLARDLFRLGEPRLPDAT